MKHASHQAEGYMKHESMLGTTARGPHRGHIGQEARRAGESVGHINNQS